MRQTYVKEGYEPMECDFGPDGDRVMKSLGYRTEFEVEAERRKGKQAERLQQLRICTEEKRSAPVEQADPIVGGPTVGFLMEGRQDERPLPGRIHRARMAAAIAQEDTSRPADTSAAAARTESAHQLRADLGVAPGAAATKDQLMTWAKSQGIKQFRVMNKAELVEIAAGASLERIREIQKTAVARWDAGRTK